MRQFDSEDGTLETIEPRIEPNVFVVILFFRTVDAQGEQFFGKGVVISSDKSTVAHAAKIFRRVKTKTADLADRPGLHTVFFSTDSLCGILDERYVMARCDLTQSGHIGTLPVKVYGLDGLCPRGDSSLDL